MSTPDADIDEEWRTLGARLREIREYLGISQQNVAAATGIPRTAVSDIERGRRKVDSLELRKLSKLYRYPVSYLLGESGVDEDEAVPVSALARVFDDLTDQDRQEVLRFAEYLRFSAQVDKPERRGGGLS
ncbi:MAG: helix-turn-helix transcriptional regulator [Nocardioidaceae bacterium]